MDGSCSPGQDGLTHESPRRKQTRTITRFQDKTLSHSRQSGIAIACVPGVEQVQPGDLGYQLWNPSELWRGTYPLAVSSTSPSRLVLRPTRRVRWLGWLFTTAGFLVGSSSLTGSSGVALAIIAALFAAQLAGVGASLATATATVDSSSLRYRYGLIVWRLEAKDAQSVAIGAGSGGYYPRVCLHVVDSQGKRRRLTAMQRPNTAKSRVALERDATLVRQVLGISPTV